MKHILFVYPTEFNPMVGGVERVTDLLARELIKRGYKVSYLHHKRNEELLKFDFPAQIYYFPNSDYISEENIIFFHQFLNENKVDVIINQAGNFEDSQLYLNVGKNKVRTFSALHSKPLLNYEHLASEELVLKDYSLVGFLKLLVRFAIYPKIKTDYLERRGSHLKWLFGHTDKVVLLSRSYTEELRDICREDFEKQKVVIIPNPNAFETQHAEKKKQLLYVGRLEKGEKRPDRLLKIWQELYKDFIDWELVFVGDGKEKKRLEKKASRLERVSFKGFQSPVQYYKDASIFCLVSNLEGFPMVLPEAMSFGTIPFAFDSFSAVHDIIKDGKNGCLVTPFSIQEYVGKLRRMMSDDALRKEMSENCINDVKIFSISNIVDQWEKIIK